MTDPWSVHPVTGQHLVPFRATGAALSPVFSEPNRETVSPLGSISLAAKWLASVDRSDALRERQRSAKLKGTRPDAQTELDRAEARDALYDIGQDLIARVRQSWSDAAE